MRIPLQAISEERKFMANRNDKPSDNVPGAYYVDNTCIDCDLCRTAAPRIFKRQDEGGYSYAFYQPKTAEEIAEAEEGRLGCPTDSIGNDGEAG